MNKLAFVAAALLLPLSVLATTDASADNTPIARVSPAVNPGVVGPQLIVPIVRGSIIVPASVRTGAFAGLTCATIKIGATSVAYTNPPSNGTLGFAQPVWTRTGSVSGDISTGLCSYDVVVPASSPFTLNLSSTFKEPNQCGNTILDSVGTTQHLTVPNVKEPLTHAVEVTRAWWQGCPR